MKNRQFETIEEAKEYEKRMKREKKHSGMTDDEYNILQRHLIILRRKAVEGDREAINMMFFWIEGLLVEKREATKKRKKTGGMKKANWTKKSAIFLLAVTTYKRMKKVDPAFRTVDPWEATVAHVLDVAPKGVEIW